jgi:subtilisin
MPFLTIIQIVLLACIGLLALVQRADAQVIPNAYIIQISDLADVNDVCLKMQRFTGGKVGHVYHKAIRGFSIQVPPGLLKSKILSQSGVIRVEPDLLVELASQTLPTSVNRIDIDLYNTAKIDGLDERVDVDIAIIDTGIDIDHPDLNVVGGRRFLPGGPSTDYDDDNGHGTEVAGVLAALDNGFGIVGVAPGARLWSIKCFDQNRAAGSGLLDGMEWVLENADTIEILNMSWSGIHQAPFHRTAIQNCVAAGVVCFAAAGNSAMDVYGADGAFNTGDEVWPAYFPEVAAISCMADSDGAPGGLGSATVYGGYLDDSFAGFSNYSHSVTGSNPVSSPGGAIDLLMPGVDIYSTFMNGGYATDSGTSLSSPLAAGLAALYIAENGRATNAAGVYAIRQALIDSGVLQVNSRGLNLMNDPGSFDENIGYYTPGDFNKDGVVAIDDFNLFALAWLTATGNAQYCPTCDIAIPPNLAIDPLDLQIFTENWLAGTY